MSNTKLVVIHLKEIVYTAIFVALGIVLIILLIFMFVGKNKNSETTPTITSESTSKKYVAGVYNSSIKLNDTVLNLEIVVDEDHINSVRLINLDEAISTMYPLVEPSLAKIEEQLSSGVSFEQLEYSDDSKYTQMLLVDAIQSTLDKAAVEEDTVNE